MVVPSRFNPYLHVLIYCGDTRYLPNFFYKYSTNWLHKLRFFNNSSPSKSRHCFRFSVWYSSRSLRQVAPYLVCLMIIHCCSGFRVDRILHVSQHVKSFTYYSFRSILVICWHGRGKDVCWWCQHKKVKVTIVTHKVKGKSKAYI